jgi:hypothetical protein
VKSYKVKSSVIARSATTKQSRQSEVVASLRGRKPEAGEATEATKAKLNEVNLNKENKTDADI